MSSRGRANALARRSREWVDRQDPASGRGTAIDAWRRYQAVEGPLQSALLSLYILSWARLVVAPGWVMLLTLFFLSISRMLMHGSISSRDLLPGAALTAVGLVLLMLVSSWVMELWVDLYARDYGGFGVVMAIFFWILFSSAIIVGAASLSPALAERRRLRGQRRPAR